MSRLIILALLSLSIFLALYGSIVLSELTGTAELVLHLKNDFGFPAIVLSTVILALVTAPLAYLIGSIVITRFPDIGIYSLFVSLLLLAGSISMSGINVYYNSVVGESSILKIVFVVAPLVYLLSQSKHVNKVSESVRKSTTKTPGLANKKTM